MSEKLLLPQRSSFFVCLLSGFNCLELCRIYFKETYLILTAPLLNRSPIFVQFSIKHKQLVRFVWHCVSEQEKDGTWSHKGHVAKKLQTVGGHLTLGGLQW